MRTLLTTVSLAALLATFGAANAQTSQAPAERPGAQQQMQQRQQPSGGEERQRQPSQNEQRPGGQAQQSPDADRSREPARAQQNQPNQPGSERRPSQAQDQQQQQRAPSQAQQPASSQQPSQAQQQRDQDRQRGQAQQDQQRQQQPSTAQPSQQPGTSRQPSTAQQPGSQQGPSQAQQQQPGSTQQPAQAQQQQPAGSGEVSARIASNPQIQTRIEQSVTNIRPANVNVEVRVGASIPRTVELQPVPQAIIEIAPRYREYRVIRVREEVVIVNPRSYEVVEVIRIGGGTRVGQASRNRIELSAQQRQLVLRHARQAREARVTTEIQVTEGRALPREVELHTIPSEIVTEVPTLREYRYFVSGDQVVIVDPSSNVVTEVIR